MCEPFLVCLVFTSALPCSMTCLFVCLFVQHDDTIMYMRPKVQGYNLLDYDKTDELVQLGVASARKCIRVRGRLLAMFMG